MTSQITKTVRGYEINATGIILSPGHRVAAGFGEDYDTGTVDKVEGGMAAVRWDSLVTTTIPINDGVRVIL